MRIFVASTYEELESYRAAATRSILTSGNISEDMLFWPAEDSPPLDASIRRVRSSDLLILLIAHRYGNPPEGRNVSITELEFDEAVTLGIPILAFSVDPTYPWPPNYVETDQAARARLEAFIQKVGKQVIRKPFTSPESLEVAITHSLTQFIGQARHTELPRYVQARARQVGRPDSLYYSADSTIQIGHAPDGAPLLLSITRHIRVEDDLAGIAARLGKDPSDPVFSEMLAQLNQEARTFAATTGIYNSVANGRPGKFYVPNEPLTYQFAPNLFQSMLGVGSAAIPATNPDAISRSPDPVSFNPGALPYAPSAPSFSPGPVQPPRNDLDRLAQTAYEAHRGANPRSLLRWEDASKQEQQAWRATVAGAAGLSEGSIASGSPDDRDPRAHPGRPRLRRHRGRDDDRPGRGRGHDDPPSLPSSGFESREAEPDDDRPGRGRGHDDPPSLPASGFESREAEPKVISVGGMNRFLCIALDSSPTAWSGGWAEGSSGQRLIIGRPFIEEGLERLRGVGYVIQSHGDPVATYEPKTFIKNWTDLLASADDTELQQVSYKIIIPRSSIARFTLDIIDEVSRLHERGRIHGDIKPSNILVSRNDTLLIDDAELNIGDISPTVTPGWSPGEQLLRKPLSVAADIFSLGQLVLHVLAAEPLGREVRYRMPGGQIALLFDDPAVYIEPANPCAPVETREDWCRLIERALRTDPNERWPTARSMADEMRSFLQREDLRGEVEIKLPWGDRPSLILDTKGQPTAGWVIGSGYEKTLLRS